jgi:hypothetical protein
MKAPLSERCDTGCQRPEAREDWAWGRTSPSEKGKVRQLNRVFQTRRKDGKCWTCGTDDEGREMGFRVMCSKPKASSLSIYHHQYWNPRNSLTLASHPSQLQKQATLHLLTGRAEEERAGYPENYSLRNHFLVKAGDWPAHRTLAAT